MKMNEMMRLSLMYAGICGVMFLIGFIGYGINYWATNLVKNNAPVKYGRVAFREDGVDMSNIRFEMEKNCELVAHLPNGKTEVIVSSK